MGGVGGIADAVGGGDAVAVMTTTTVMASEVASLAARFRGRLGCSLSFTPGPPVSGRLLSAHVAVFLGGIPAYPALLLLCYGSDVAIGYW